MRLFQRIALASLSLLLIGNCAFAAIGPRRSKELPIAKISPEQAAERLQAFCDYRGNGDFALLFELRTGKSRKPNAYGSLWGSWQPYGLLLRIELWQAGQARESAQRYLLLGGKEPTLWKQRADTLEELTGPDLLEPLMANIPYSAYDLLFPYMYWKDFAHLGNERVKGRPAYRFSMFAPTDYEARGIGRTEVALDAGYNALLKSTTYAMDNTPLRFMELLNFRKVDDQWLAKQINFKDLVTGQKVQFKIRAAAVNLKLPQQAFSPNTLSEPLPEDTVIKYEHFR